MTGVEHFLKSAAISPSIEEIRAALGTDCLAPEIHHASRYSFNKEDSNHSKRKQDKPIFETASVLIALWEDADTGIQVLLTQRSEHLRHHPGQIAFPGGKQEPQDDTLIHTALREAEEEVGLKTEQIDVLGQLGTYFTTSGFSVCPVIAQMSREKPLMLCYDEVESIHWVPLTYMLDPKNFNFKQKIIDGALRDFFEIHYQDLHIWGLTAAIFYGLYQALSAVPTKPE